MALARSPVPARLVFTSGPIITMTGDSAEVVVVAGDRIEAVGDQALAQRYPDATVVGLGGATLVPGFIDAHHHLSITALHPRWADLTGLDSLDAVGEALAAQARREPDAAWVRAVQWTEPATLRAADLDALGLGRPVMVVHYSLHQCVVDSSGLDLLGIGAGTPDPDGGRIERDQRGRPTGLLVERAWSAAGAASQRDYEDPERWGDLVVERARALLAEGITAVHDAACSPAAEAVYRSLARAGRLPISVLGLPHPATLFSVPEPARLDGPPTGDGDEWFRVGPAKLFADGGMAIAADGLRQGRRRVTGIAMADVVASAGAAAARGFDIAVHAMGNVGVGLALDAVEAAQRAGRGRDHRSRIEHLTLATREQLRRAGDLGVAGVVQPGFMATLGANVAHVRWDEMDWMPFASARAAGVRLAASSDAPCGPGHPLVASCHGHTRRPRPGEVLAPRESLDYRVWLEAWTAGAAWAGRQEAERGAIAPGLRADFAVLDGPLDAEHPPRVAQTWVGGELAYSVRS